MEMIKTEVVAHEQGESEKAEVQIRELRDFELMFVGGGQGDILLG